jgi:hypothetical protein
VEVPVCDRRGRSLRSRTCDASRVAMLPDIYLEVSDAARRGNRVGWSRCCSLALLGPERDCPPVESGDSTSKKRHTFRQTNRVVAPLRRFAVGICQSGRYLPVSLLRHGLCRRLDFNRRFERAPATSIASRVANGSSPSMGLASIRMVLVSTSPGHSSARVRTRDAERVR